MRKITQIATLAFILAGIIEAAAEITMPKIFGDNMILQRQEPVNVWGKSLSNATVEVEFNGKKVSTKSNKDGLWYLRLPALQADKSPKDLVVYENSKESKRLKNVLVGEVWIAGGQSNMAYGLGGIADSKKVFEKADTTTVRYYNQGKQNCQSTPQFDNGDDAHWIDCKRANVGGLSAVAYTFAQMLSESLDIPVGIVQTAISGTHMFSWIPKEEFETNPLFSEANKRWKERLAKWDYPKEKAKWDELVRTYPARVEKAKKEGKEPPPQWTISDNMKPWENSPDGFRTPAHLYNGRVAPITNFTARGIIWYQGENDNLKTGFRDQFYGFIQIWRKLWRKPDMPFIFVQLPSWTCANWENMRFDQFRVSRELKNVAMAVSIDTGEEKDVHPKDKLPFIQRLAKIALHDVYGKKDECGYSPIYKDTSISGNIAKVNFYTGGRKLVCKGEPRGFEVKVDGKWKPAIAKISDNAVLVKSADSNDKKITAVRYLWKGWALPDVCIYNDADNPASGFTSDSENLK